MVLKKTENFLIFLLFIFCITHTYGSGRNSKLVLKNNEYTGLLIAIGRDVPEDPQIIPKLKEYFTELSRALFTATKRRAYLKDVTILVPSTWAEDASYQNASTQLYSNADVVIDKVNEKYGHNPYVKHVQDCGMSGEYMHLTNEYLLDPNVMSNWGPVGSTLLHEWGHLRWGLFDEYPLVQEGYPRFYHDSNGDIQAVRCSKDIKGVNVLPSLKACATENGTHLPEDGCLFRPHSEQTATASLMGHYYLDSVTHFCDNNPNDPQSRHNAEAPNKHNRVCRGQSAWEVMRQHEDFKDGVNPSIAENVNIDTKPTFKVVREGERRYVLVMDMSDSMEGLRLKNLKKAAAQFILSTVEDGSYLGIVTFAENPKIQHNLTKITSEEVRHSLLDSIPSELESWTSMGGGLYYGVKTLKSSGMLADGGILVLISDGEENAPPYIKGATEHIRKNGVIVDTVLFTADADQELVSLAADTGGQSLYAAEDLSILDLNDALTSVVTGRGGSAQIQLASDLVSIAPNVHYTGYVHVDSRIGMRTQFFFSWDPGMSVEVELFQPDDTQVVIQAAENDETSLTVGIAGTAQTGKWKYVIKNGAAASSVSVRVVSSPIDSAHSPPITLEGYVNRKQLNYTELPQETVIFFADLKQGYGPIIDANVVAYIDYSNGSVSKNFSITLADNGGGADITAGDGVYSGFYVNFVGNGRYSVHLYADNSKGTAKLVKFQQPAKSPLLQERNAELADTTFTYQNLGDFQRSAHAGFFGVVNQSQNVHASDDLYPPIRISDLKILSPMYDNRSVVMVWTAPGDDLDKGRASHYEIYLGMTHSQLMNNMDSSVKLKSSDIVNMDLANPLASGSMEVAVVKVPSELYQNKMFAFVVMAYDKMGKGSDMSNIVSAMVTGIPPPDDKDEVTLPTTSTTKASTDEPGEIISPAEEFPVVIVAASASAGLLLIIIIVVLIVCVKRRKKGANDSADETKMSAPTPDLIERLPNGGQELPTIRGFKKEYESEEMMKGWSVYGKKKGDRPDLSLVEFEAEYDENKPPVLNGSPDHIYETPHGEMDSPLPAGDFSFTLPITETQNETNYNTEPVYDNNAKFKKNGAQNSSNKLAKLKANFEAADSHANSYVQNWNSKPK